MKADPSEKCATQELESVWEAATMQFEWRFNEGPPCRGESKQPPIVDVAAKRRRWLFQKTLAEPPVASHGLGTRALPKSLGGNAPAPTSEGFTALLSNGDELLDLAEHCRVVANNVVDAPHALLDAGNIRDDAIMWQQKLCWFQVSRSPCLCTWTANHHFVHMAYGPCCDLNQHQQ